MKKQCDLDKEGLPTCGKPAPGSRKVGYALFLSVLPGIFIAVFVEDITNVILLTLASAGLIFLVAFYLLLKRKR